MARAVAIGERDRVMGFALAGAEVVVADEPAAVRAAWSALGADVAVVVLTPAADAALAPMDGAAAEIRPGNPLTVVLPA